MMGKAGSSRREYHSLCFIIFALLQLRNRLREFSPSLSLSLVGLMKSSFLRRRRRHSARPLLSSRVQSIDC